jgi:hypothetical protein
MTDPAERAEQDQADDLEPVFKPGKVALELDRDEREYLKRTVRESAPSNGDGAHETDDA